MKKCKDCQSPSLVPRGAGFRNQCHACWSATQRTAWKENRPARILTSQANYAKHAPKRRAEASAAKSAHREYYSLSEWFRRKGIRLADIPPADLTALVEMKKALKAAKAETRQTQPPSADPH